MAKLKITRADGSVSEHQITPKIEYAFEQMKGIGLSRAFREQELQTDVYWLAWKCLMESGLDISMPPFGEKFLEMLSKVEVIGDDSL